MRTRLGLLFLAGVILAPVMSYAQASITGVVKDTSGAVLPGVTVEAASPALIEKMRTGVTDSAGQYRIIALQPGVYTVTFTLPGFSTVKRDGLDLAGSFTATVNAELRVGSLEETITVSGETPIVDVQSATRQRVMDHEVMDVIPTGRSDRSLANLIPGVYMSSQDVGGSQPGQPSNMGIHGGRGDDQRIMQNGVNLTVAQGTGAQLSATANLSSYQEVQVDTSAGTADQALGGIRINFIPRDGGNTYAGNFFGAFANESMQSNNFTQELRDRGLTTASAIKEVYDINPGFGGPLRKDRLWFYGTMRYNVAAAYPGGVLYNLNANNPNVWTYAPDPARRGSNDSTFKDVTVRATFQATPKNKIGVTWGEQRTCFCEENVSATTAPEAGGIRRYPRMWNLLADWTAPVSNRLLLEASMIKRYEDAQRFLNEGSSLPMISVLDQALGNLNYRAPTGFKRRVVFRSVYARGSASYITGSHAFKTGVVIGELSNTVTNRLWTDYTYSYRFNNGVPNLITLLAAPHGYRFNVDADTGVFAQDKWTIRRLTINYGIRYDYYKDSFPGQTLGPGPLVPNRNLVLPEASGVSWHDVSPRSGAAYDLFGNGKTAVKVALNKYLSGQGEGGPFGIALAPVSRVVLNTTRAWTDGNGNFAPDCDLSNPATQDNRASGGDLCGAMVNPNFGTAGTSSSYDPDTLTGWGKRPYNWEFSAGVQHEVAPRLSADLSYFRRWYGNFFVTDDRSLAASDFSSFGLPVPVGLPNAGSVVTGLFDINPARFGIPADNYITSADNYGKQIEHWDGFDLTFNARLRPGMMAQGGLSTGRTVTDNCDITAKVPEVLNTTLQTAQPLGTPVSGFTPLQYCHQQTKFLTQAKFFGVYTVPRIDVLISGMLQSVPGPQILATYNAPNALVAPILGRNLAGNAANFTVSTLVEPGTLYGDRLNQLDLRIGKVLRIGRIRAVPNLDIYNVFNGNAVLTQNNTFGGALRWQQPQSILTARFVKISVQVDF